MWLINSRKYSSTLKTPHTKNLTGKYKSPTKWQHPPHLRTCLSMFDKAPTSYWLFFRGFLTSPGVATSAARQLGTFCQKHPKHNNNWAKHKCWPIWKKTRKPKQDIASDNNWKKQSDKFARNVRFKIWLTGCCDSASAVATTVQLGCLCLTLLIGYLCRLSVDIFHNPMREHSNVLLSKWHWTAVRDDLNVRWRY